MQYTSVRKFLLLLPQLISFVVFFLIIASSMLLYVKFSVLAVPTRRSASSTISKLTTSRNQKSLFRTSNTVFVPPVPIIRTSCLSNYQQQQQHSNLFLQRPELFNPRRRSFGTKEQVFQVEKTKRIEKDEHNQQLASNPRMKMTTTDSTDPTSSVNEQQSVAPQAREQQQQPKQFNKRANLPFNIMDKEIEEYSKSSTSNDNSNKLRTEVLTESIEASMDERQVTEYEKWVRRLYATNLFLPVKLGLQNMEMIHTALGSPTDDIIIIHIAGTNGKGSVTYKIAKILQAANPTLKVGLFTSPHISSFRERMQVNDVYISEEEVVQLLPPIYKICQEQDIPATFFEITTALAFSFFKQSNCDVIVLETGLGGRLDATNIVKQPAISIITSIGLEHTRILGDTVELIAVEKGGIIKPNCPVLVGPNVPHEVLRNCAKEKQASAYYTIEDVLGAAAKSDNDEDDTDYDIENSKIATAAIKIIQNTQCGEKLGIKESLTDENIQIGTSQRPPCRFETIQIPVTDDKTITVILDVAHNPPAMDYMVRKLRRTYGTTKKIRVVVGMSSDKDMKLCGLSLLQAVQNDPSRIHLVEAAHPRAAKLEAILAATGFDKTDTKVYYDLQDRSVTKQLNLAKELITASNDNKTTTNPNADEEILIVCGSVFLMAEAREALGIDEPRDSDVITELAGAGFRHSQENFGNNPSNGSK